MNKFIPRPYQEPIPALLLDYWGRTPKKHPVVALPTGSGKTVVLCDVIDKITEKWPRLKILVLSHVKEILQQDYDALKRHVDKPVGLYSAGLGKREYKQITVAGIQSVYKHADMFKSVQLVIIDEAHLIQPGNEGMYHTFLSGLPKAKYLGLTATPYRLGSGLIYGEGKLFDDLIYDLTTLDHFNKLVDDGYLCRLVPKGTKLKLDTDGLHTRAGDFIDREMSLAFDKETITNQAIEEIIERGKDYKKWLIFAIDIAHAEHITERLLQSGIRAMVVHSKMGKNRDIIFDNYRKGKYRALVNVNIATTGVDVPDIDLIALLRPTKSPVLHVQSIGRGLRIHNDKDHCLVLDFAGNTNRLGPINHIIVTDKKKGTGPGEPIMKECPDCMTLCYASVRTCPECGRKFEFKHNLSATAYGDEIMASNEGQWYNVDSVTYALHEKPHSPTSVLVRYHCGITLFKEWICVEHNGFAGYRARHWMSIRIDTPNLPKNSADLLALSNRLKVPARIKVKRQNKYPEILEFDFK